MIDVDFPYPCIKFDLPWSSLKLSIIFTCEIVWYHIMFFIKYIMVFCTGEHNLYSFKNIVLAKNNKIWLSYFLNVFFFYFSYEPTFSPALISVDWFKVVVNKGSWTEKGGLQRDKHFGKIRSWLKMLTDSFILLVTFAPTTLGAMISSGDAFSPLLLHL